MSINFCLHVTETHQIISAIDNVESILTEIAKDIEDVTGMKSHFMIAGPEPKRKGKMVMFMLVYSTVVYIVMSRVLG